jgi:pyridoxine/pyridoxamine 5'-phosphate oxidase
MKARRPSFAPGYGIAPDEDGLLDWAWAAERLAAARNYWVVTASADGAPHAAPVWGLWQDGAFVFGTDPSSRKGRNIAANPRVVVHLESGDEVVSLEGEVEYVVARDELLDVYEAKYAVRPAGGPGWCSVRPTRAFAWREEDYPRSATRFDP